MGQLEGIRYFKRDLVQLSEDPFARLDFDHFYNMELFNKQFPKETKFKKLRDIVTLIETGNPVERSDYSPYETQFVHVVPRDIKNGSLEIKEPIYLNADKGEELSKYSLTKNDVLIAISSNCGDSTVFVPPSIDTQYTISHYIVRIKVNESVYDHDFLVYYLNHPRIRIFFRALEAGKTQQNLSKVYLRNFPVIDLSIEEQQPIVKSLKQNDETISQKKAEIESLRNESSQNLWEAINH